MDEIIHITLIGISSVFGYSVTSRMIPVVANYLLTKTNLYGLDMGKKEKTKVPESLGIVVGLAYLLSFLLFFIVVPYILISLGILKSFSLSEHLCISSYSSNTTYNNGLNNVAAITSIVAMLLLGFIDDCCDLRWRYKLMFPFAASIPLLSVYYINHHDRTTILVPQFLTKYLNLDEYLNLGLFYYIFMLMFVIFCTNAINIYAGINGLEVGQTLVLTLFVILYNLVEVTTKADCDEIHVLSLQILLPFLLCSYALFKFNRYPAKVFVGDSYCYFAGMTIAVVGILGHFSEEILLFAIPQVFNFVLSIPQLFKIVPCPRHRLPKFNPKTGLREPSTFEFRYSELNLLGKLLMKIYSLIGFAKLTKNKTKGEPNDQYTSNNLTLINLWLCWFGPKDEQTLCNQLLRLQSILSLVGLSILIKLAIQ